MQSTDLIWEAKIVPVPYETNWNTVDLSQYPSIYPKHHMREGAAVAVVEGWEKEHEYRTAGVFVVIRYPRDTRYHIYLMNYTMTGWLLHLEGMVPVGEEV